MCRYYLCPAVFFLLSALICTAEAQPAELEQNPFLTDEEEREFADLGEAALDAAPIDYLALSAILYSPSNKSRAVINGRILEIGSQIDNKEIIEINAEAVILKDAQAEYIIKLKKISGA
jgi:hypothetical protein